MTDSWKRTGISALWPKEQMLDLKEQLAGSYKVGWDRYPQGIGSKDQVFGRRRLFKHKNDLPLNNALLQEEVQPNFQFRSG